jgi:hypothetical protein
LDFSKRLGDGVPYQSNLKHFSFTQKINGDLSTVNLSRKMRNGK